MKNEIKCEMKGKGICPLPLENLIDTVRKKWALSLIIIIENFGSLHFNGIKTRIKDGHTKKISAKILSARLKELVNSGLVKNEKSKQYPFTVNYSLTEKGRKLYNNFLKLGDFYEE